MMPFVFSRIPYPDIDPVFLRIGPLEFRWYGLMYLLGLVAAYFVIKARAATRGVSIAREQIYDLLVYAALGVFLGGRLGYILFYNLPYYLEHPAKIIAVWEGGMAFHGGLLGTILAIWIFCRRHGFAIYPIADLATISVPIGLGLGRLGNFINGELFGRPSDVPWCMVFPAGGPECRHPSQLYETGLEGVFLFLVLWWLSRLPTPPGVVFWSFMTGYGLCRVVVEFFRAPDLHLGLILGPFSMGQLLSAPMIMIGAFMVAWRLQQHMKARPRARSR